MANPLTGDFDGVFQISGRTINRLLATMHQNAGTKPTLPMFPTSIWTRIGDGRAIDGVRGSVQAQLSTPLVDLIDGSIDHFFLSVNVRARFKPDPGSSPLPEYINGTIRAQYRIQDIDPHCLGWSTKADKYLWIRVIKDSVQFHGTAVDARNPLLDVAHDPVKAAADQAASLAKVTRQIAGLLATRFAAVPHPMTGHLHRGWFRSLHSPDGDACVATPVALKGPPAGTIHSISNHLLDGADAAVAVTRDYIMAAAQPMIDALRTFTQTISVSVHVDAPDPFPGYTLSTVYRVAVDPPSVTWSPHGSFAVVKFKVSGTAKTDSVLPNASFTIDQDIVINFDGASESLRVTPGSRSIAVTASGLGAGVVAGKVKGEVAAAVANFVTAACATAQSTLDAVNSRKGDFIVQLRTMDDQADLVFERAEFLDDGLVLRGAVSVARRKAAVTTFDKTLEHDGFSALFAWIPGGRIDKVEWSWTMSGDPTPSAANYDDRFVLRRPPARRGTFGLYIDGGAPLPGIDGNGQVCLRIKGVQMDAVSGAWIPIETTRHCARYGLNVSVLTRPDRGRLLLRDVPATSRPAPFHQLAVVAAAGSSRAIAANTLLVYVNRAWDEEIAHALRGLGGIRRADSSLVLLVLFREGVLTHVDEALAAELQRLREELGLAFNVNEDVGATWSSAFALPATGPAWRLLSPAGGVTWMRDGHAGPNDLVAALNHLLIPSPAPRPTAFRAGVTVGDRLSVGALRQDLSEAESACPPPPYSLTGIRAGAFSFVRAGSAASETQLRALAAAQADGEGDAPLTVAIVDGADAETVDALRRQLGLGFALLPDPHGTLTDRFGVGVWPTTVRFDQTGVVSAVDVGALQPHDDHPTSPVKEGAAS